MSAAYFTGPGAPTQIKTTSLDTTVRRLDLPAGTYLIVASGRLESFTNSGLFDNGVRHVRCRLTAGGTTVNRGVTLGPALAAGAAQTVAFDLVHSFASSGTAEVHCWVANIVDNVLAFDTTISAIKAG